MNVLIASSIDGEAIERLEQEHQVIRAFPNNGEESLRALIRDCEALVFRSGIRVSADLMGCAPGLKLLVRAGSGMDNLDVEYAQKRGMHLVRIPQPSARAVAEMAFAFMLALSRRLLEADHSMRNGRWEKHEFSGYLLRDKTLGVVGIGNTGSCVAEMGVAWGMRVIGCVQHPSREREGGFCEKGIRMLEFDQVIADADYLSIHVPLKDNTRRLLDADALSRMKPGAYLINLARGGIVDEQALYESLTTPGGLRGAALDVHEHEGQDCISPLSGLDNVILTPHIGAMAIDAQREIGQKVVETINAFANANGSDPWQGKVAGVAQGYARIQGEVNRG
jgi:D-3-phosphoglycerate dehydrogenase